ncbi:23S rRNA (guanine-N-2-) -methyltransferase rlmG [Klebsiella quasipneumoniae]|nr:23S rRNA (guanine-N-2-) -methyltransferase rlmG [Klebsiella quasipneumoniae]SXD26326.1 23S rRNA (guanine-N-2-) -methyltransferase rlmG [Klebsiella quasipneumoniae]
MLVAVYPADAFAGLACGIIVVAGNCTTIATNNKFVILKATKVRKQR